MFLISSKNLLATQVFLVSSTVGESFQEKTQLLLYQLEIND